MQFFPPDYMYLLYGLSMIYKSELRNVSSVKDRDECCGAKPRDCICG